MGKLFSILILLCISAIIYGQDIPSTSLNIGDPAPPLRVKEWLKGMPLREYERGKVYVLEFWATWCVPCRAAMPHLSELARKYRDEVTVIGI